MDIDRDLLRQQRGGGERQDRGEDPGRSTNTERMRPADHAGGANGMYPHTSPLANVGAGAGDSESVEEMGSRRDVFTAAAPTPMPAAEAAAPALVEEKPPPKGKQPAARSAGTDAKPADAKDAGANDDHAGAKTGDATTGDAPAGAAPMPASEAKQQGGRGGRSSAGSGRGGTGPGAAAARAGVTFQVARTAPGDASPTRTTLAVGEEVNFTAAQPGNWRATTSTGTPNATNTSTFRWKATDTATNPTVTYSRDGQPDVDTNFRLVAPTSIDFRKTQDDPQLPAGVGMVTNLTFGPQNVNFYNVEWLEEPGGPSNVRGYFQQYISEGRGALNHDPNPNGVSMEGATNNGVDDHAFMAGKPRLGSPPQWSEGSMEWVIPNVYRVGSAGARHAITTVTQRFDMHGGANAGSMTVTKGGASATQNLSGQMVGSTLATMERFLTQADARNYLASQADPQSAIKQGLNKLPNFRLNDRTSFDNLIAALRAFAPAPVLYTSVRCTNTYSWFTQDSVTFTVGPHTETFDLNTGRHKIMRIPWLTVIDPATFNSNMFLNYTIVAEGHTFTMSQPFPFNEFGTAQPCPGSEGRYTLLSYLRA